MVGEYIGIYGTAYADALNRGPVAMPFLSLAHFGTYVAFLSVAWRPAVPVLRFSNV